ncbi:MAG: hypothetical protein CSA29_02400 [Desulfobacterales bacterium]|nr:MAG: hypothetical protein CSA29_02400 [Desulfobacterales bacterium]
MKLPLPDKNNIIDLLPSDLSAANEKNKKQFRFFSLLYDPAMNYFIRPRIHKADPRRHTRIWQELIGKVCQAKILDLACGTGALMPCLDKKNEYTGIDLSYEMLKKAAGRARKKGFSRCRLIRANAEVQVFADDRFDLVVTDTALHMIPDWQKTIVSAARSLGPQGVLTGALPVLGIDKAFDKVWRKYVDHPQFHALTTSDIQKACLDNRLDFNAIATNGGMLYFRALKKEG